MADSMPQNGLTWVGQLQTVHASEIPQMIKDVQVRLHKSILRQWRQTITGDPDKRIRDSMDDKEVQTMVKQVDAFSFAMGVFLTMLVEYIVLSKPEYLAPFAYCLMPTLFIHRFYSYSQIKEQFFMIDFCYFLNLSTYLQTMLCPNDKYSEECEVWFKTNFVLAMGPISFAIVAWQNSLVFHSIDKVTSFALHMMPPLLCYLMRWNTNLQDAGLAAKHMNPLTFQEQFVYPMTFYLAWQLFYSYIQFTIIEKDKTLVTSLRHLAKDHKNPSTKMGTKLAVRLGFIEDGEKLDPYKLSIIVMFTLFQFFYMIVCLIGTRLLFNYEFINSIALILITAMAVWNGGSYYIQIFSQRYNAKFQAEKANSNATPPSGNSTDTEEKQVEKENPASSSSTDKSE